MEPIFQTATSLGLIKSNEKRLRLVLAIHIDVEVTCNVSSLMYITPKYLTVYYFNI